MSSFGLKTAKAPTLARKRVENLPDKSKAFFNLPENTTLSIDGKLYALYYSSHSPPFTGQLSRRLVWREGRGKRSLVWWLNPGCDGRGLFRR